MTIAVPASTSASAGSTASGGVCPSASAAMTAATGTVNSVMSETTVGLVERSTRLKMVWPSSWARTVSAAMRAQSSAA